MNRHRFSAWVPLASFMVPILCVGCSIEDSAPYDSANVSVFSVDWRHPLKVGDGEAIGGFADIAWAGQLSDGTLVVVDRRLRELSFFPPESEPFVAGSSGGGPGEFEYLTGGGILLADSVLVLGSRQLSVFDPKGGFARTIPNPHPGFGHEFVGLLRDSILVLRGDLGGLKPGLTIDSFTYVTLGVSTGTVRHQFSLPDRHSYYHNPSGQRPFWTFPPFFGDGVAGVLDSVVVWGKGGDPYLFLLDEVGRQFDSLQVAIPERPLEVADLDRVEAERLGRAAEDLGLRRNWEQMFDDVSFPERHPFFDHLIVGSDGVLWLRLAEEPPGGTVQWWGHDVSGTLKRIVRVPSDLDVVQFSDSSVVAVETSQYDVQRVVVLHLIQGDGSS